MYTVMAWHRDTVLSSVIVSDCRADDKKAVATFTSKVMDVIQTKFPTTTTVSIWSDGWS